MDLQNWLMLIPFFCCFLLMYHIATPNIGYLLGTEQLANLLKNINKTVGKFTFTGQFIIY